MLFCIEICKLPCTKILSYWVGSRGQSEYTKLEVENARLEKQISELLKQTSKTSNKINFLEKENLQLQRELEKATVQYEASVG
jgi:peptidoglycan hydrolase CwlO-like protein